MNKLAIINSSVPSGTWFINNCMLLILRRWWYWATQTVYRAPVKRPEKAKMAPVAEGDFMMALVVGTES